MQYRAEPLISLRMEALRRAERQRKEKPSRDS
jgi:hypothetical protein